MTSDESRAAGKVLYAPRPGPNRLLGLMYAGFATAAVITALTVPAHILVQGVLGPLGLVPSFDRRYTTFVRAVGSPLVKIYLLGLVACSFYLLAWRAWYVVRELGVHSKLGLGLFLFGLAAAGTAVAGSLLFTGP